MSDNKFILQLKGQQTPKSVVEIKNDKLVAPFVNVPNSSDAVGSIIQDKDSSVVVAKGADVWKLDGGSLVPATNLSGNGSDYTGEYAVSGSGLWVNAVYTFPNTGDPAHPVAEIFNSQTKWVLQLCGKNLHTGNGNTIDFSFIVKIGSSHIMTKAITVSEQANFFCKRFVLDFSESEQSIIKASGGSNLTVQLLCADDSASATIYNGMTILTALQRRIDASAVSASFANVEEVLRDGLLPNDYFSNAEFIDEIEDGEQAYAVFARDGDNVNLAGWTLKDDIATTTQLNDEITVRENADLGLQNQINANKDTMDGHIANTSNPHQVTKAQVGLGNVDNTSDLDKPISTATQTALDLKMPISTKYGAALSLTINSTTYVVTAQLKDQDGNNLGTAQTIDLPLESVVVSGAYDSATKEVVLTLQDGSKIRFSVADLVSGLQTEITALNMLSADLVDDTNTTHKFVTTTEKSTWNGKQDAISDLATIRSGAAAGATAVQPGDLATVATTGSYNDLTDTPVIPSMSNRVNGAPLSNLASVFYGTSSTAAATVEKVVSIPSITTLDVGTVIVVQPTVTSTVANSTIKLNNFSAYPMRYNNTAITTSTNSIVWNAAYPSVWVFDGTYWRFVAHGIDTDTTYGSMSVSEGTTGTATSNRVVRANYLKQIIQGTTLTGIDVATTGAVTATDTITDGIGKLQATKANIADLATVATSGSYNDLSNKPTIPAAQVNSDWNANSGVAQILNKPTLATVATSGSYNDLSNTPTIPTVNNATITITQGGVTKGSFTLNQASGDTIDLDAGGSGSGYHPDLFDVKWADHICNDVQWLRADTFSWQDGGVYEAAYNHLADDISGKSLSSETISGITVQFYLADDGHKICPDTQESNVAAVYNATGVAWYYIIDTTNERFKLPRTKFGVTGLRDNVGDYVEPELPNIRANAQFSYGTLWPTTMSGAFKSSGNHGTRARGEGGTSPVNLELDASESSPIYKDNATVQPPATQMYLYFYIGNFTQTAIENTAGITAETLNGKVDKGHQVIDFQAPTADNSYTWYRKYADGWVEQGGYIAGNYSHTFSGTYMSSYVATTITLPVEMANTNVNIYCNSTVGQVIASGVLNGTTALEIMLASANFTASGVNVSWQVSGMAAS